MKKPIIITTALIVVLAIYTWYDSAELTSERKQFVRACATKDGVYAEGVLTSMKWKAAREDKPEGEGVYALKFVKSSMHEPTRATLSGVKSEIDASRYKLEKGKSYSVCMKRDHVLIDYYKSF